jgi:hypothetical protein
MRCNNIATELETIAKNLKTANQNTIMLQKALQNFCKTIAKNRKSLQSLNDK